MKPAARLSAVERHWQAGRQAAADLDWPRAARAFGSAASLSPRDLLLKLNLARAWLRSGELTEATRAARSAHALQPADALACRLLAECLTQQRHFAEAAQVFDALSPDAPRDHDLLLAHGNALFHAGRAREAIDVLLQALALRMDSALAHYRLGLAFKDLGQAREASECFRTAILLDDKEVRALALSLLVHESQQACDWTHLASDTRDMLALLDGPDGRAPELLSPFALLAIDASPAQQRVAGALRTRGLTRGVKPLPAPTGPRRPGPLRIGYLSSDFCRHATSVLMAELLERRDRQHVEVFLYSHSPEDGSEIQQRVRTACDHYLDVTHLDSADVARRMRADGLDIAVDLKGHTRDSRFEILAWRPAPVQVAWLGYPASTGADFIDYLIGDPVVTPLAHAVQYSEHIAQMPHSYQPNDTRRSLPPAPSRASLGLPDDAVVLCCFNQTYKINPSMLDHWARILQQAPAAVLWMLAWNPHAEARLRDELGQRGVVPERLYFAPKRELADHLARLRCADLFLDTWPCNAHTTASEALWAGVPVLTVPGTTFASRVAASLVSACGLDTMVCATAHDYVQTAVALSSQRPRLQAIQQHLAREHDRLPLFDSAGFARDFEALLMRMAERHAAGLPPAALPAQPALPADAMREGASIGGPR